MKYTYDPNTNELTKGSDNSVIFTDMTLSAKNGIPIIYYRYSVERNGPIMV